MLGLEAPERIGAIVERSLEVLERSGRLDAAGVVQARQAALAAAAALTWPRGRFPSLATDGDVAREETTKGVKR
jgi:hypothetical protein